MNLPVCEVEAPMPEIVVCPMNTHGLVDKYEKRVSPLGDVYYCGLLDVSGEMVTPLITLITDPFDPIHESGDPNHPSESETLVPSSDQHTLQPSQDHLLADLANFQTQLLGAS